MPNQPTTVELLDFREAAITRNFDLIQTDEKDELKIALQVVARLMPSSPSRAKMYANWLRSFKSETSFISSASLKPVDDSFHIFIPDQDGCSLKQAAVQINPQFPGDRRYYIESDIWNAMSPVVKAGLMLHEVIYREARIRGQTNSKITRYFNSLLFTTEIYKSTLPPKDDLIASIKFYVQLLGLVVGDFPEFSVPADFLAEARLLHSEYLRTSFNFDAPFEVSIKATGGVYDNNSGSVKVKLELKELKWIETSEPSNGHDVLSFYGRGSVFDQEGKLICDNVSISLYHDGRADSRFSGAVSVKDCPIK
jgi:hypothetical protein